MTAINNTRMILRWKVGVRFVFLIISILVCYFHSHIECYTSNATNNVIIGMFISILAWCITDIIVFMVEIYEKYKIERDEALNLALKYSDIIIKRLLELRKNEKTPSFIRKLSGETNDVSDVKSMYKIMIGDVYELMNAMYTFQYKSEYYVLSREFITYRRYIERFYYILILNICDKDGIKNIYKRIFIDECSTKSVDGIKQINVLQKYVADVNELYDVVRKNLTLDDSSCSLPDCFLVTKRRSIISSYCVGDLPNNTNTAYILIFRPYQYLEDMLSLDITNISKLKLMMELL